MAAKILTCDCQTCDQLSKSEITFLIFGLSEKNPVTKDWFTLRDNGEAIILVTLLTIYTIIHLIQSSFWITIAELLFYIFRIHTFEIDILSKGLFHIERHRRVTIAMEISQMAQDRRICWNVFAITNWSLMGYSDNYWMIFLFFFLLRTTLMVDIWTPWLFSSELFDTKKYLLTVMYGPFRL